MRFFFTILCCCGSYLLSAQSPLATADYKAQNQWVDSMYNALTLKERVGQLFMVQAFSEEKNLQKSKLLNLIKNQHIGGVIYSNGGPIRQAKLNNELQATSHIPLLVGMDAEWGLRMRLDSTYAFPWNMTLGAIKDLNLIRQTGRYIGEHCKRLGVHFNFAPVVDINTNPNNPIIGNRSFGQNKFKVTEHSLAFMQGMQASGVLATAKHFPGHGDTDMDSHKVLPTVTFSKKRIENVELYPYKKLISKGLSSVMVAHLNVPSLEYKKNYPSSLSKNIVTNYLKKRLKFKGLIFTDALDMKGVTNFSSSEEIDLQAFLAGNDVLLMSKDVKKGSERIQKAYKDGLISEERLAHSVKKILSAKYKVGLHLYKPIDIEDLISDLNRNKDIVLHEKLMENALTLVKNSKSLLPLKDLELRRIAYVSMGDDSGDDFFNMLQQYGSITKVESKNLADIIQELKAFNTVIIGFHKSNDNPWKSHKFSNKELVWLQEIARSNELILSVFAKPYALNELKSIVNIDGLLVAYQNSIISQRTAAQLIFGAIAAKGQLPVSINNLNLSEGLGIKTKTLDRLSYGIPESVGMNSHKLERIDSLANYAIENQMTPGIQLMVARHGKVIYDKSYGYHTYAKINSVQSNDLYDVASLTKILSTLPLFMALLDDVNIDLNTSLGELLPEFKNSNKSEISLLEMLSHFAQLKPWIPFYKSTLDSLTLKPNSEFFSPKKTANFPLKISDNTYLRKDFTDTIQQNILKSDLLQEKEYRYSDLPYYFLKQIIENHYGITLDKLIQQQFYNPMGVNIATYNPLDIFEKSQIPPTEEDDYFRFQKIHGHVHDMGAAMQNGVGGHAGLFSNANDVAKIMQMYLQKGSYGGETYLKSNTIDIFNTCHYCDQENRRGVGFDKPQLKDDGPTCGCLSMNSFGHSGFTGTYAWADPDEEIIYVFLSNRTYPESKNNRLLKYNIRTEIQRLIYEAIID